MAALEKQLASSGLSEAKRYGVKKQLAMKKAARIREERRIKQLQQQQQ